MIKSIGIFVVIMAQLASTPTSLAHYYPIRDAQSYILEKLASHDVVFAGTVHQQPAILQLMADLLPRLHESGVTHLALEIASDQQARIDQFFRTGRGLDRVDLHHAIDCPAYRNLFRVLKELDRTKRPSVVAIDLPTDQYGGPTTRNEYMATRLAATLETQPSAKVLTMLGGLHVLRRLKWQHRVDPGHAAIRSFLEQWQPGLRLFSLVHIVDRMEEDCDFSRRLAPLPGTIALDLDKRFRGWQLGVTAGIALRPSQPYDLVDGVVVY